jgi:hypothetical protein
MARTTKSSPQETPQIEAVVPSASLPGGEVELTGANLGPIAQRQPVVMVGQLAAPILLSRSRRLKLRVPDEAETAPLQVLQNGAQSNTMRVLVAGMIATDVHVVANPAVDRDGNIYATLSGPRGQTTPVSVYRVGSDGEMLPFVTGIMNATGLALDPEGFLYVSSRNDGTVSLLIPNRTSMSATAAARSSRSLLTARSSSSLLWSRASLRTILLSDRMERFT